MGDAAQVARHYNDRQDGGRRNREQSRAFVQKSLNNWIKSCLIDQHLHKGAVVMDLACGKGGDLQKWKVGGVSHVTGVDIAEVSLEHMKARYEGNRGGGFPFSLLLYGADCTETRISQSLPQDLQYDLVSCQFALHYSFRSEEALRTMLANVSDRLKIGGHFIGTTVDSNVLIRALRTEGPVISNNLFQVKFPMTTRAHFPAEKPFGIEYVFSLVDGVTECPEFLVHIPTLARIAKEYGLEMQFATNFHEFALEMMNEQKYHELAHSMRVFDRGQIPEDDWGVAYLYCVFSFRKLSEPSSPVPTPTTGVTLQAALNQPLKVVSLSGYKDRSEE